MIETSGRPAHVSAHHSASPGRDRLVGRCCRPPPTNSSEHTSVTNGYLVDQRDGMKQSGQLVIAVLAATLHRQIADLQAPER